MGAAADLLSAVLEPRFSDRSFAYRPGRGARTAVSELLASPRISGGGDHCGYRLVFRHRSGWTGSPQEQIHSSWFIHRICDPRAEPRRNAGVQWRRLRKHAAQRPDDL